MPQRITERPISQPRLYRAEAKRLQQLASNTRNRAIREQWSSLAEAYERLAKVAEDAARDED